VEGEVSPLVRIVLRGVFWLQEFGQTS